MTSSSSHAAARWHVSHLWNNCWRSAQQGRHLMSGAVTRAEQAIGRAREQAAPPGDLPVLVQQLRSLADQVDRYLVLQARAGVHQASFEEANLWVASVVSASTRIEYAATSGLHGTCGPRDRSIATAAELEARAILDQLAATVAATLEATVDGTADGTADASVDATADASGESADRRPTSAP